MKHLARKLSNRCDAGFTLVEMMIAIAVLTIVISIAIPAYNGYVREARIAAARINIEPLRLALEDHWLDNGAFVEGTWIPGGAQTLAASNILGWQPDGDENLFDYDVAFVGGSNQVVTITVTHRGQTDEPQSISINRLP